MTSANVGRGSMTLAELCAAAITWSDNTAANLVLAALGGPAPFTASLRGSALRDSVTRLDHREPDCNAAMPGDPRDTTTPRAIARDLAVVSAPGSALAPASRALLGEWLRECQTGLDLLRAGLPPGWAVGDKTGSGARGTRNDVAIVRPPGHRPLVIAAYLTGAAEIDDDRRARAIARVGTIVADAFAASRAR